MIYRNLSSLLKKTKKSIFLLGPRQAGKSTLIQSLKPELSINLADQNEFFHFSAKPSELRDRIETSGLKVIFLDEIQRLPGLLNTVQVLLDEKKDRKFFITGSSARKLKRGQANLLPGRVLNFHLGPLVCSELGYLADQEKILRFGSLPEVYLEKEEKTKSQILRTYFVNYIQEEIKAEALVRNIESFSRALPLAIQTSGQFVDYSKLAKQAKVSRHSLSRFYEVFEDTLIGNRVWPDAKLLAKADLVKHPKFYVFDTGIYNANAGSFDLSSERKGILFEHLIYNQLLHSAWSKDITAQIGSFRTRGGLEVDFILTLDGKRYGIEGKAGLEPQRDWGAGLSALKAEYEPTIQPFVAYLGNKSKKIDNIWCLPWQSMIRELGL